MREIIFDTETTGLDNRVDRIIEIGGIELFNHFPTGNTHPHLHQIRGTARYTPTHSLCMGLQMSF